MPHPPVPRPPRPASPPPSPLVLLSSSRDGLLARFLVWPAAVDDAGAQPRHVGRGATGTPDDGQASADRRRWGAGVRACDDGRYTRRPSSTGLVGPGSDQLAGGARTARSPTHADPHAARARVDQRGAGVRRSHPAARADHTGRSRPVLARAIRMQLHRPQTVSGGQGREEKHTEAHARERARGRVLQAVPADNRLSLCAPVCASIRLVSIATQHFLDDVMRDARQYQKLRSKDKEKDKSAVSVRQRQRRQGGGWLPDAIGSRSFLLLLLVFSLPFRAS